MSTDQISTDRAATTDPINSDRYRSAMRRYPAGVTIVTLAGAERPVGFTATSFASLSARPPLVSFNIAENSSSIDALRAARSLVIHFLGEHQRHLAQRFASDAEQRFADRSLWSTLDTGEPVLHGTPIWLRTEMYQLLPIGDHTLVIGMVTRVHDDIDGPVAAPLLYHDGAYHKPTPLS